MTDTYYIATWEAPSERVVNGLTKRSQGQTEAYLDEDTIIRDCEDYGKEPVAVVQMVRRDGRWTAQAYRFDLDQIKRDVEADFMRRAG